MNRNQYDYLFKYILIGDSNVGKSCILLRLLEGRFKNQHEPTLGVQFGSKLLSIKNKTIKLQIWDTAGQQTFKSITRAYYKGSIAAIMVFDITNQRSFQNLSNWLYELKNHSHQKIHIILIGNKKDLSADRVVSEEAALSFARKHNCLNYYETSALNGDLIDKPFIDLATNILSEIQKGDINIETDSAYGVKPGNKNKLKYPNANINIVQESLKKQEKQGQCSC